ncbi:MAG: methyltransferase domain-containing protein [Anaerolineales bacterium]
MTNTRDLVKQQFGAHAQNYVTSAVHAGGESLDRMIEAVRPQPDWRALDIATGGGHTALAFAPHVREVVATDLTAEMLAAAEAFSQGKGVANVSFREADATALPFADGEFDLVTCRLAPHHFPDCAQFVREMARVLRPGGVAAVIDNAVPGDVIAARHVNALEKLRDPSHNWMYSPVEWEAFFGAAGFGVTHLETFRKRMDFEAHCDRMSVPAHTRQQLRVMLRQAPAPAREALSPEFSDDPLRGPVVFYLGEVLIIGGL